MGQVVTIGLDIAKSVFQVHGVDGEGQVVVRRQVRRAELLKFFGKQPACLVGIEACASAHHWARELSRLGHQVRLMPPSYVKPYVKRQKNNAADAEAICEAVTRPTMRLVEIKSPEQQSVMVLHRVRQMLMRQRIQLSNAIRGHMAEFGLVAPIGREGLRSLMQMAERGDRVPEEAGVCLGLLAAQLQLVNAQILDADRRIRTSARSTEVGRRLMTIPGVGPLLASALVATIPDPKAFTRGRNLAAWIGLVPKQNSSGGRERLGASPKPAIDTCASSWSSAPWRSCATPSGMGLGGRGWCSSWLRVRPRSPRWRSPTRPRAWPGGHDKRRKLSRADTSGRRIKIRRSAPNSSEGRTRLTQPAGRYRRRGKPTRARAPRARAFGRDRSSRKASWPAVTCTAPTGRTHGRTDQLRRRPRSPCQRRAVHTWRSPAPTLTKLLHAPATLLVYTASRGA